MRVNPDTSSDLLQALAETQREEDRALQQISSGRRVGVPSDDPAAMSALIQNRSSMASNDQFSRSIAAIKSQLQMADSTLGSVIAGMDRAISLGVEGGTGTESQANRDAVAAEVTGIRDNILSLANASINGVYLFAGTKTDKPPFEADSTAGAGVTYQGNSNLSNVAVGENRTMQVNLPGDQIFMNAGGNAFEALNDLISALKAGDEDAISNATSEVSKAFDQISSQRVFFGNALSQIEDSNTLLSNDKLDLSDQENQIGGADLAASISTLLKAETARNAALQATSQISRHSLIDYLG